MRGMMYIIKPDGAIDNIEYPDSKPSLEDLQREVGGYIQIVPNFDTFRHMSCVVYCDEEGLLKGYELNPVATKEWRSQLQGPYDPHMARLWGRIVILTGDEEFRNG